MQRLPVAVCLLKADRQPETEPVASKTQCATRSTRFSGPEMLSSHLKQLEQQHFPSLSKYSARAKAAIPRGRQGPQGSKIVEIARLAVLSLPSLKFLKICQSLWLVSASSAHVECGSSFVVLLFPQVPNLRGG